MPTVTVLIIVALIGLALLLLIVGLIFYFAKRGKGAAAGAQPQVPGPNAAAVPPMANAQPGYPGQDAPAGGAWGQQQAWGGAPDALAQQPMEAVPQTEEWQSPGVAPPPPAESNQIPGSAYQTQESMQSTGESEAYVTTPSAPPEPPPNPELFMTRAGAPRKTSMMEMRATLHADDGSVINLDRLMLRVGRHPECDIVVPTPGASRQHAEFEFRDGEWVVTDLNSGNGTWVNGVRVQQHNLVSGDEVRIDQTRFRFMSGA
jgi:hypothetical protein